MLNLKKTRMKKNLFLALSIISAFIFIAGVMCTIMGDDSPVKFIVNHDFTTFIDDTLAAELTVLRHSLLFWILCCFRYFSRKWHKIPAGEFVR